MFWIAVALAVIAPLLILGFVPALPGTRRYTRPLIVAAFVLYGVGFATLAFVLEPSLEKQKILWAEGVCGLLLMLQALGALARQRIAQDPGNAQAVRLARRAQVLGMLIRVVLLLAIAAAFYMQRT